MKKEKKCQRKNWVVMGIFAMVGVALGIFANNYIETLRLETGSFEGVLLPYILLVVGIYAGIYIQLIIHETGHLVFGLLSGYSFSSFRVGSFMWMKQNDALVCKKLSVAGTGGQCLMTPPELQNGKLPVLLYNLGGSIMNLIAGAVFFALYLLLPQNIWVSQLLLMLSLLGVAVALANGIPLKLGMVDNDGYNALNLEKNNAAMKAFWMQLKVSDELTKGKRLKDMPEEWFAVPSSEEMKNGLVAAQGVFATNRLMDQQRFDQADQLIAQLLTLDSGIIGLHRSLMLCDRIYCELIGNNRKEIIGEMRTKELEKFMKAMKNYPSVIRTEYAYALLLLKDTAKAEELRRRFEKVAKTYPYPGDVQSERELMEIAAQLN